MVGEVMGGTWRGAGMVTNRNKNIFQLTLKGTYDSRFVWIPASFFNSNNSLFLQRKYIFFLTLKKNKSHLIWINVGIDKKVQGRIKWLKRRKQGRKPSSKHNDLSMLLIYRCDYKPDNFWLYVKSLV